MGSQAEVRESLRAVQCSVVTLCALPRRGRGRRHGRPARHRPPTVVPHERRTAHGARVLSGEPCSAPTQRWRTSEASPGRGSSRAASNGWARVPQQRWHAWVSPRHSPSSAWSRSSSRYGPARCQGGNASHQRCAGPAGPRGPERCNSYDVAAEWVREAVAGEACGTHRYTGTSRMWTARPCRRPSPPLHGVLYSG